MPDKKPIGLKALIDKVKEDLLQEHDKENPLFVIENIDLQISFTVESDVNGGIDLQVVQLGTAKQVTEVHTIDVTLKPLATMEDIKPGLTDAQKKVIQGAVARSARGLDTE